MILGWNGWLSFFGKVYDIWYKNIFLATKWGIWWGGTEAYRGNSVCESRLLFTMELPQRNLLVHEGQQVS